MSRSTKLTDAEDPLVVKNPPEWGDICEVLAAPAENISSVEGYCSCILAILTFPLWIFGAILAGLIQGLNRCACIGGCIPGSKQCCSCVGMVLAGKPLCMAWVWWRAVLSWAIMLARHKTSRLSVMMWEWESFGSSTYYWHGMGIWTGTYAMVDNLLKSVQPRTTAFGNIDACVPDLFAKRVLIFLPNTGPESEWALKRKLLHEVFLDQGLDAYRTRTQALAGLIAEDWQNAKLEKTKTGMIIKAVAKSMFYVMFGTWIDDNDAAVLANWRKLAAPFVLPRISHNLAFGTLIKKVKTLRQTTVQLLEKYDKQDIFIDMNKQLPPGKNYQTAVGLADELMFVVGFAGIGGTSALTESAASFLQCKLPKESPGKKYIKWGEFDTTQKMVAKYKADPEKFLREVGRMDPPVTSANSPLSEDSRITLAGTQFDFPAGTLQQYSIGLANRDEGTFRDPSTFDPDRANLKRALTWNGAWGVDNDENLYPRICPGRVLSMHIAKTVINHILNLND